MKQAITGLLILVFCVLVSQGQTTNKESKPPGQWLLSIKSGGAPWTKAFDVELDQFGYLLVMEEDPAKMPDNPVTRLRRKLPAKDVKQIYEQAVRSVQTGTNSNKHWTDGTWITVKLTSPGRARLAQSHLSVMEEEAPELAKLLALINKHLPTEHQVY